MTQHIQDTAITQRIEFASTELETASGMFSDFMGTNQIMNPEQITKIETAIRNIGIFIGAIGHGLEIQEKLLKIKNENI